MNRQHFSPYSFWMLSKILFFLFFVFLFFQSMNAAYSFNLPSAITVAPIKDCHKAPPFLKFCELLGNFPHRNISFTTKKIKNKTLETEI